MHVRKNAGRQSAEVAEETRRRILRVAMELFASRGYDNISLREIGQKAHVSHGLLRYYFGSKRGIWLYLCDRVNENFQSLFLHLIKRIDRSISSNRQFFQLLAELQAYLLLNPYPMSLIAASFKGSSDLQDYFMGKSGAFDEEIQKLFVEVKAQGYMENLQFGDIKWLLFMFTHVPVGFKPLMRGIYGNDESSKQLIQKPLLIGNWKLFASLMASQLGIKPAQVPSPTCLEELVDIELQYLMSEI